MCLPWICTSPSMRWEVSLIVMPTSSTRVALREILRISYYTKLPYLNTGAFLYAQHYTQAQSGCGAASMLEKKEGSLGKHTLLCHNRCIIFCSSDATCGYFVACIAIKFSWNLQDSGGPLAQALCLTKSLILYHYA